MKEADKGWCNGMVRKLTSNHAIEWSPLFRSITRGLSRKVQNRRRKVLSPTPPRTSLSIVVVEDSTHSITILCKLILTYAMKLAVVNAKTIMLVGLLVGMAAGAIVPEGESHPACCTWSLFVCPALTHVNALVPPSGSDQ